MDLERWKTIEDIFQDALDLDASEREKFIDEKCAGDAELRAEVEKLIDRYETDESFLESPVWTDSRLFQPSLKQQIASSLDDEIVSRNGKESFIGRQVGAFRLVRELGKGGMGMVYLAERADGEFQQKVAVKLIKRGMDLDFIVKRFRHERQILANLNHPNIARLLDGGTTQDDLPYFVMEFVEGVPFLKFSEKNKLELREKLELFLAVCEAVSYAHRRKIIHRDIKPSNIIVTDEGTPKLLDFGIAKILDPDLIHESVMPTGTQMRLMTPEYASPEQVRGDEITPASDQYSLGVLLYELITGTRPYKFSSRSPHEIARVICEEVPSEPSSGEFGKLITESEDFDFDQDFCKKLDRIVLKALRKSPDERYDSVEEFAYDIRRFLSNQPVRAEVISEEAGKIGFPTAPEEAQKQTSVSSKEKASVQIAVQNKKAISPRRSGIKQGLFAVILSFLMLPFLIFLAAGGLLPGRFVVLVFLLSLFGGLIRGLYALIFESGEKDLTVLELNESKNSEAVTQSYTSSSRSSSNLWKIFLPLIGVAVLALFLYEIGSDTNNDFAPDAPKPPSINDWRTNFASTMKIRRLTTTGKEVLAAVSPDGNQIAYVSLNNEQQTLWLRQTEGVDAPRQIIPPDPAIYLGLTFSPDGKNLYYTKLDASYAHRHLYKISTDGNGEAEKIAENVMTAAGFSADGSKIAYYALSARTPSALSLYVGEVNPEGKLSATAEMVTLSHPEHFLGNPAFSADGQKIIYAANTFADEKHSTNFFVFDTEHKTNEKLDTAEFSDIAAIARRGDTNEIIVCAGENVSAPHQLWLVDYTSGETHRLTNDLNDYMSVSLDTNSTTVVSSEDQKSSNLWLTRLDDANNESLNTKPLTEETNGQDGLNGLEWTAGRQILYAGGAKENGVNLMNPDGSNNRRIDLGDSLPTQALMSADNRFLYFIDEKQLNSTVWRYEIATGSRLQITKDVSSTPAVTHDDKYLIYAAENDRHQLQLYRIPTEGGESVKMTLPLSLRPAVSPDDRLIAYYFRSAETANKWVIGITEIKENGSNRLIDLPPDANTLLDPFNRPLEWSPDGNWLYYLNDKNGVSNIFKISSGGNNKVRQLTNFTTGRIFNFSVSPDGKQAVLARGSTASNVVIFKGS